MIGRQFGCVGWFVPIGVVLWAVLSWGSEAGFLVWICGSLVLGFACDGVVTLIFRAFGYRRTDDGLRRA